MNRQQRRAAERQQARQRAQRRVMHPAEVWMMQKAAIVKHDMSDLDPASKTTILLPFYTGLNKLQFGGFDQDDFRQIAELNAVGGELAYRMQFRDRSGQISNAGHHFVATAEALNDIGIRFNNTGRFVATGDELKALNEAAQYLSELLDLAPTGYVLAAMEKISKCMEAA